MHKAKQHIAFIFLTFFILMKVVGLHTFVHSEGEKEEHCEVCEYVITSNSIPLTTNQQIVVEQTVQHSYNKQEFYEYSYQFIQNQIDNTLFCRPPPTV